MSNFAKICRTCLITDQSMLSVNSVLEEPLRIDGCFRFHLNLTVSENDDLPSNICLDCLDKLLQVRKFHLQCLESEKYLKGEISTSKITSKLKTEQTDRALEIDLHFDEDNRPNDPNEFDEFLFVGVSQMVKHEDELDLDDRQHLEPEECTTEADRLLTELAVKVESVGTGNNSEVQLSGKTSFLQKEFSICTDSDSIFAREINETEILQTQTNQRSYIEWMDNIDNRIQEEDDARKFLTNLPIVSRNRKSIYCQQCHETFESKNNLRKHFNSEHGTDNDNGFCLICRKQFLSRSQLMEHLPVHKFKNQSKRHVCQYCNRAFHAKDTYRSHLRIHTGERPFICTTCGKTFAQRNSLKTHMTLHSGKTVPCSLCDKKFSRRSQLKLHYREHNDEKPYSCDICPKKYRQMCHLKSHLLTHSGTKAGTCDLCGSSFTQISSLRKHMFTHSKRPYKCPKCPAEFIPKWRFRKHLISNHDIHDDPNIYKRPVIEEISLEEFIKNDFME